MPPGGAAAHPGSQPVAHDLAVATTRLENSAICTPMPIETPMRTRRREQEDFARQLADAQARIAELHRALVARDDVDVLTELPSLRRFRTQLDIECKRARRHCRALSIALIDLDGFRTLNAKHGFMAGDDALCAVAKTLRAFTRAHDVCARSGPDEFAVM